MALHNLSQESAGDFLPTIRYNAREGNFFRADRVLNSDGQYTTVTAPITDDLAKKGMLIDVANTEVGWIRFEGEVDFALLHHKLPPVPQPTEHHKAGFRAQVWLPDAISEGANLRHFSHTALSVNRRYDALHDEWVRLADDQHKLNGNVVPHATIEIEDVKTQRGTFQAPVFKIVQWVPRPDNWPLPHVEIRPDQPDPASPTAADVIGAFDGEVVSSEAAPAEGDLPF